MTARDNEKNIHTGHRKRLLERFSRDGFDGWQNHEVLEALLFHVLPRVNTNLHGHRLIAKFGSLRGVLEAGRDALMKVHGIGTISAEYLAGVRDDVSEMIIRQFREEEGELNIYQLAFLADWFMRGAESPLGILILGADGCFADYLALPIVRKDGMIDAEYMFSDLGGKYENCNFSLFVQPEDRFSVEEISEIRRYTFRASFILDEIYVMNGREPVPTLFADRFHD